MVLIWNRIVAQYVVFGERVIQAEPASRTSRQRKHLG